MTLSGDTLPSAMAMDTTSSPTRFMMVTDFILSMNASAGIDSPL